MNEEQALYAFIAFWLLCGILFWISTIKHDPPTHWRAAHSRDVGWNETLTINLLICLIGGPLWWVAMWACRRS